VTRVAKIEGLRSENWALILAYTELEMTLPVYRLRRLLAVTAVILTAAVTGMYFYARSRTVNVLKEVPNKIGYDIKQTANGFQFSKSDGKRTLFTVQASNVKEFKLNGNAELHNVSIILYGRDSSRFDQIYGDDFSFNQKTGDVVAKGEVQIDLVANPTGLASPDQAIPKELKNPIHLKTSDLVFNRDTGNAETAARVEFSTPQATGWAVGVKYAGKSNTLTLASQIHVVLSGPNAAVIDAEHGFVTGDPRQIVLDHPRMNRNGNTLIADTAVFHLGRDNNVQDVEATGNVTAEERRAGQDSSANEATEIRSRADQAEFQLTGAQNLLRTATLTGNVHVEQGGAQPMEGTAGRVVLDFAGRNQLQMVHALGGARIEQKSASTKNAAQDSTPQDFTLTAPVIDFTVAQGHLLDRAVTSGAAQITISPAQRAATASDPAPASATQKPSGQTTVVTAGKFEAKFATVESASASAAHGRRTQLSTIHGSPDARIVNSASGQPDRVSTSDSVDAVFLPQGGIESITQQGSVAYTDGLLPDKRTRAWAASARYTPADQMLMLTGNPRVENGSTVTTAKTIQINRATGDALADGDVKSTYSEMKEQPDGALLASSSPIHVTSHAMTAHSTPGIALYTGNARLWQDSNIIEAPSIQFDRDRRFVTAQGTAAQPVKTVIVQPEKKSEAAPPAATPKKSAAADQSGPIAITSQMISYTDSERKVHYSGGVTAKGTDFTAASKTLDAYLLPRSQTASGESGSGPGQLDHMVAEGDVVITQPNRRADGQKLVYTANDDKFVLTGGASKELPSIFDAEQGKITGVSLTFFRRDDRVLVEGEASAPVVTQTRVAR
jgi:lipopolysaccharide export system protein LptA